MTTAVKIRRRTPSKTAVARARIIRLSERAQMDARRVDAEAGVIFDVKILGHDSDNGRRYTPESMKAAIPLYQSAFVNIDHPQKATDPRSSLDRTAWLENVRYVDGDGLRGDLHFLLPLDEYQKKVLWAAENKPNAWGLSHNADGRGNEDGAGVFVVEAITEVRSVDLVPDPATNRSLFEGKTMPQTTLRKLIEASKAKAATKTEWLSLLEDELADLPMDAPAEPLPAEAPVEGDWKQDLVAAIGKLVSSEATEDHDMARKIMNMLKPAAAEPASSETTTENEEEGYEDEEDKKDEEEEKPMESRAKKTAPDAVTLTEAKALCKLAGVAEDAALLGMLEGSPREKAMSLVEWAKGRAAPVADKTKPVRASAAGGTPAPTNRVAALKESKEVAAFLLGRN